MKNFLLLITIVCCTGCTYDYFSRHNQKQNHHSYGTARRQKQVDQLHQLDSAIFTGGAHAYIRPLMANRKGDGVYGYNRNSTHFGHVQFFLSKNDSIWLLPRDNKDSLQATVTSFLKENHFSGRQIRIAMKRLSVVYAIYATDSF